MDFLMQETKQLCGGVEANIFSLCFQITCSGTGEQNVFNAVLEARYSALQALLSEEPANRVASKTIT